MCRSTSSKSFQPLDRKHLYAPAERTKLATALGPVIDKLGRSIVVFANIGVAIRVLGVLVILPPGYNRWRIGGRAAARGGVAGGRRLSATAVVAAFTTIAAHSRID